MLQVQVRPFELLFIAVLHHRALMQKGSVREFVSRHLYWVHHCVQHVDLFVEL